MKIRVKKKTLNEKYIGTLDIDKFHVIFVGGAGAGKSLGVAHELARKQINEPGRNYIFARKVANSLEDSVFADYKKVLKRWNYLQYCKVNITKKKIKLPNGNQTMCIGLDKIEKSKKSITFDNGPATDIWLEEATETTWEDYNYLLMRLRGQLLGKQKKLNKHFIMTTNPDEPQHYIKTKFIDEKYMEHDTKIIKSTYKDNKYLTKKDIERLESISDEYFYKVYVGNEWATNDEKIFNNYIFGDYQDIESKVSGSYRIKVGADWGFTNPTAFVKVIYYQDDIYAVDEEYGTKMTNDEIRANVGRFKDYRIIGDSAEPSRIQYFLNHGYNIEPAFKGKNSIMRDINWLQNRTLHIDSKKCPNLAREIKKYKFKKQRSTGIILDEPVTLDDHGIDALRYGCNEWVQDSK